MTGTPKAFVLTAHPGEARPLAKALGLRASNNSPFPLYSNEDTVLAVSGQGAQSMATACGFLQGSLRPPVECMAQRRPLRAYRRLYLWELPCWSAKFWT